MKSRTISLGIYIVLIATLIIYSLSTGLSWMYWFVLTSPLIALFFFSIWYAIWGWGNRGKRFKIAGSLFLLWFLIIVGIGTLTRYEGSTSGASLPKLVWKWSERRDVSEDIETRINAEAVNQTIEEEAATASTNFLGPGRDGMWQEVPFSLDWSSNPPVELWRRPVGEGWSSFAIARGRAITCEQAGANEQTTCIDLLTGKNIWTHADPGVDFVQSKEGSPGAAMGGEGPRSTPTIFENKVYVLGSTGIAKCLAFDTGTLFWKCNVIEPFGGAIPEWGKSSAPLILEPEKLVVFTGSEKPGATLVACDLETGKVAWTYEGKGASYSSPRILNPLGIRQIVSVNAGDVAGVDPKNGKELWRFEWKGTFPKVSQPILISENRIFASASYGAGSPLIELSKTEDGKWSATQVWKTNGLKTKFSSASIIDNHAYGIHEGRLAAMSLKDGSQAWRQRKEKYGFGQQILVGKNTLIVQTEAGDVALAEVNPEGYTETARLPALSSMTWNAPSLAGRFLIVRNDREAVCYLLPKHR